MASEDQTVGEDAVQGGTSGAAVGSYFGPWGTLIGAVAGTALGVFGGLMQAGAQADAARSDAQNKRRMAAEVLARAEFNKEGIIRTGLREIGNIKSQYGAANVDIGSGTPLLAMEDAYAELKRKVVVEGQSAQFKADQYLIGGNSVDKASADAQAAGNLKMATTLLTSAATIYGAASRVGGGGGDGGVDTSSNYDVANYADALGSYDYGTSVSSVTPYGAGRGDPSFFRGDSYYPSLYTGNSDSWGVAGYPQFGGGGGTD